MSFPLGQGVACPPLSERVEVVACTAVSSGEACSLCTNGATDVDESDVDCGGASTCGVCQSGAVCRTTDDCASGHVCSGNMTLTCLGACPVASTGGCVAMCGCVISFVIIVLLAQMWV